MMRKIIAYCDLKTLPYTPEFDQLKNFPFINVSTSLKKAMNCNPAFDLKYKTMDFATISRTITPWWNNDSDKLNKNILISEYLHKRQESETDPKKKTWLKNCCRNRNMIADAINLLNEAQLNTGDVLHTSDDVELMVDAWKYILQNSETIQKYNLELEKLNNKDSIKALFGKILGDADFDTIVIHSFFYITPQQEHIFNIFEKNGFNLLMLIPYDHNYPYANRIWEKTYSPDRGYPVMSDWIFIEQEHRNLLGQAFENKSAIQSNIELCPYKDIVEMANSITEEIKDNYSFYSPDPKTSNELLKDYFPEKYSERDIASFPLGQFLIDVFKMWDEENNSIVLEPNTLCDCFYTGWVSANSRNSKDLLSRLSSTLPYFKNCTSEQDWIDRIDYLKTVKAEVVPLFEKSGDSDRWEKTFSNPLSMFSAFNISISDLDCIKEIISKICHIAVVASRPCNSATVECYLETLCNELRKLSIGNEIAEKDAYILDIIKDKLTGDNAREFNPVDIKSCLLSFINEEFNDYTEVTSSRNDLVLPFYHIDSAQIMPDHRIHIMLGDMDHLPGQKRTYQWPLTKELIESVHANSIGEKKQLISDLIHIFDSNPLCNRYFTYSALNNDNVIISWITESNGKNMEGSPYVNLLHTQFGIEIKYPEQFSVEKSTIEKCAEVDPVFSDFAIQDFDERYNDAKKEYALCPLKYLYGYLLENNPSYSTNFQWTSAISGFLSALRTSCTDIPHETISANVLGLFPNLELIEQAQIKDYSHAYAKSTPMEYKGNKYAGERSLIMYPNADLRAAATSMMGILYTPEGRKGLRLDNPSETKGACRYCAHSEYCRRTIFPADEEEFYD